MAKEETQDMLQKASLSPLLACFKEIDRLEKKLEDKEKECEGLKHFINYVSAEDVLIPMGDATTMHDTLKEAYEFWQSNIAMKK